MKVPLTRAAVASITTCLVSVLWLATFGPPVAALGLGAALASAWCIVLEHDSENADLPHRNS
jgi:hypothetical protein